MARIGQRLSLFRSLLCLGVALASVNAMAQGAYPTRPIRLVVGYSAGGPSDISGRKIAALMTTTLGQTMIVENKAGAGGKIAADYIAGQPNDGYTLFLCSHSDAINTVLYQKQAVTIEDFSAVSMVTKFYYVITVPSSIPANNLAEFIKYGKSRPNELNYGLTGKGSSQELLTKRFEKETGLRMTPILYKGSGETIQDLLAGRIHFVPAPPMSVIPLIKAGQKMKIIATTSPQRMPSAPEIPTMTEQGIPITWFGWFGVCGPKGMSAPVVRKLNDALAKVVQDDSYKLLMDNSGFVGLSSTPEELTAVLRSTAKESDEMIREYKLQLE